MLFIVAAMAATPIFNEVEGRDRSGQQKEDMILNVWTQQVSGVNANMREATQPGRSFLVPDLAWILINGAPSSARQRLRLTRPRCVKVVYGLRSFIDNVCRKPTARAIGLLECAHEKG